MDTCMDTCWRPHFHSLSHSACLARTSVTFSSMVYMGRNIIYQSRLVAKRIGKSHTLPRLFFLRVHTQPQARFNATLEPQMFAPAAEEEHKTQLFCSIGCYGPIQITIRLPIVCRHITSAGSDLSRRISVCLHNPRRTQAEDYRLRLVSRCTPSTLPLFSPMR